MYFIAVKFAVKPESAEQWPEIIREYTESTRAEAGNIFFEWSRSLENENEYVLVEAFTDDGAAPHVNSDHFKTGLDAMRPHLTSTPKIISRQVDGNGWEPMGELKID